MKGHLKVTKIYDTHEEVVVDDNNLLTDGMSVEIVDVMTGDANLINELRPYYLQVGVSSIDLLNTHYNGEGSSLFYHLSSPVSAVSLYGDESTTELYNLYRSFIASSDNAAADTPVYQEMLFVSAPLSATLVSSTVAKEWFGKVGEYRRTKTFIDTVDVRMRFDKKTLVSQVIQEFGLFSKNPHGYKEDRPFLLAYKKLGGTITKTSDFELLIEWSIGFLGNSKLYDRFSH